MSAWVGPTIEWLNRTLGTTFSGSGSPGETGSGKLVRDTSPTLVTPTIGAAVGTSLALGGATLGANALAVTGTTLLNSATTMGAALTYGGVALSNAVTGTGAMALGTGPTLTGPIIDAVTFANLPAAASSTGRIYRVSDIGPKGTYWVSDGTIWKPFGRQLILSLDTKAAGLTNVEAISANVLLPANCLALKSRIEYRASVDKSGTTDTGRLRLRIGTAGTTGDTVLLDSQVMTAAQQSFGGIYEYRVETATTIQNMANNASGYGAGSTSAYSAAVTVSSVASNPLYLNVSAVSSSTNNTVGIMDAQLWLAPSAN